MLLQERIDSFVHLGEVLGEYSTSEEKDPGSEYSNAWQKLLSKAVSETEAENPWFTNVNILTAIRAVSKMLEEEDLSFWLEPYRPTIEHSHDKTVAVIMAGNIPLVGFHDFLCVLISGNRFLGKPSSNDPHLLAAIADVLMIHNREWEKYIRFSSNRIHDFDAVIATGSNNSSNYFSYYFSRYPHIIRKNRNSIAILTGDESLEELSLIAGDIFQYFGLGCRSVSKIYIPNGYDFTSLIEALKNYGDLLEHFKYRNNYNYQRVINELCSIPYKDAENILLKKDLPPSSPISVLNYQYYADFDRLKNELWGVRDSIQCIVCSKEFPYLWTHPGETQTPRLWDYADGVDTLKFLLEL